MTIGTLTRRWRFLPLPIWLLAVALLGIGIGIIVGSISQSQAAGFANHEDQSAEFTNRSLRGSYGFSAEGTIVPPMAPEDTTIPAVVAGVMTFDGQGGCSISDTANLGGALSSNTTDTEGGSCSYTVNSDGAGVIDAVLMPNSADTPLSFVIINRREFKFIRTDAGVAIGVAERQHGDNDDDDDN